MLNFLMLNPLFVVPLLVGIILIICGVLLKYYPRKTMNILYGYRTSRSMKNQAQWDFAQSYAATECIRLGILLSLCSVLGFYFQTTEIVGALVGIGIMLITFIILISELKERLRGSLKENSF